MNVTNILNEIEKIDPEVYGRLNSRRKVMKSFANISGKLALTAVPLAFGSMFQKAYAQSPGVADIVGVLNFALTLEYLEYNFYIKAVASGIVPAGNALNALTLIRDHEAAHVNFLKTAITASGGTPVSFTAASFDFTAKGTFPTVFSDYAVLLAVAQTFEDTGVRAYKGQAGNLISSNELLTAALRIHSVEARHAAHIRWMRKNLNFANVKPWITGKESGIGPAAQASYDGEELDIQATIKITNINGKDIPYEAATESFDEPLTKEQVIKIVTPFFA